MKIAKVIVDLPLMQTDKPFSYAISKEFQSLIELGMRVFLLGQEIVWFKELLLGLKKKRMQKIRQ